MIASFSSPPPKRMRRLSARALLTTLLLISAAHSQAAIVFSALQDGSWQLYCQTEPGAPPQPLPTPSIGGDKDAPRLSPDATQIAFEVTGAGLYVCPLQGRVTCTQIPVPSGYARRPAWNPRTADLAFVHYAFRAEQEDATLEVATDALKDIHPLIEQTGIQDFPDISPDGRRLAYTSWLTVLPYRGSISVIQQLWTLDLEQGRAAQLILSNAGDIHPRWSPDGKRIAFSSNRTGRYEIWTVAADGTDQRQLTSGPGEKTWPVWSPDGSQILFTHTRDGNTGLSLVSVDKGRIQPYSPFGADSQIQLRDADWRAPRQ